MKKISTIIITYNEQDNIEECLKSVLPFSDEIVVVDSFSTDKTITIAKKYTKKIYKQKFLGHVQQKNFAIKKAKYNWIFAIDADERASQKLQKTILNLKKKGFEKDGYSVNRLTYYLTDWMKAGGWYPDKKIRLFHKEKGFWAGENPHDYIKIPSGNVGNTKANLLHYTYKNLTDHLKQINKFATIAAQEKSKKKKPFVILHLFFNPIFKFIKTYFFQGACLKGTRGFIFSVMASFSVFIKYAKLWELKHDKKTKK